MLLCAQIDSGPSSPSSGEMELGHMGGSAGAQLEACVAGLREVVGPDIPNEELVSISLAADHDLNRAINFFYSS